MQFQSLTRLILGIDTEWLIFRDHVFHQKTWNKTFKEHPIMPFLWSLTLKIASNEAFQRCKTEQTNTLHNSNAIKVFMRNYLIPVASFFLIVGFLKIRWSSTAHGQTCSKVNPSAFLYSKKAWTAKTLIEVWKESKAIFKESSEVWSNVAWKLSTLTEYKEGDEFQNCM